MNNQNLQPSENETTPKIFLLPLVLSIVFFISIFDIPYVFYTLARVIVFIMSIIFLLLWYVCNNMEFSMKFIPIIIIAVLWNPIFPIYLDKETWVVLDILAIITEIIVSIFSYQTLKSIE